MPTYEYVCQSCDHAFEKFQSMSADPLKKCPKCGKNKLKRLVGGGAGLIFKGTGFYITDYRGKAYGESKAGESKSAGESKPAADAKPAGEAKSRGDAKSGGERKSSTTKSPVATPAKPAASAAKT